MKKTIAIVFFFVIILNSWANSVLNLHLKSNETISFSFNEKPVVTMNDETLVVTTCSIMVKYPFNEIEKFTFGENASKIESIVHKSTNNELLIYSIKGDLVKKSNEEELEVLLSELTIGTYIVKTGETTYKIILY